MTARAVLYLRSSKDRSDVSIDAQRRALHELAAARGYVIVGEYADAVESGKDDDRPAFQRMMTALREPAREWTAVLALRWEDVGERLSARTRKTGVRLAFVVTPEVTSVLDAARQRPILGLYVVANDKGRPVSLRRWQDVMRATCAKLGIEDATPRDLRAKAATDAEAEGLDYQALLGHATKRMSDRYLKMKRTTLAPTLSRNIR